MNERFYLLPMEKQQRIINAAYKVFSENSYKKAPMSEIADEGGISKALLFHYFVNKQGLYMFLWHNTMEKTRKMSEKFHVTETTDFFEVIHRSLTAKCSLIREYPYLYLFSVKAYYEQEDKIKASIQASFQAASEISEKTIWKSVDISKIRPDVDIKLMYQEIVWISDGYLRQMVSSGSLDPDQMENDFARMIEQWKKIYLK